MKRNSSPKAKVLELASFCVREGTPLEVRSTRIKGRFGGDFLVEVDAGTSAILVPELEADVHDLRGLHEVAGLLLPASDEEARAARGRSR